MSGCFDIDDCTTLGSIFRFIIEHGSESLCNAWSKKQPLMVLFRDNLTYCLDSLVNSSEEHYEIVCKTGYCGSWCNILYAAILSKKYSWMIKGCSPSKGVYPCYLFAKDLSEVYLTYMVASGDKYENTLKRIIKAIRELGVFEDYDLDASQMKLGKDPHKYRFATICFKKYGSMTNRVGKST